MPAPRTTDELLELVRKSGVVEDKRLAAGLDALRAAGPLPEEPVPMALALVRGGVLTQFQAEQVLQGKWRKFTIGKYKVLERLGAGGMGSVYLCEHILMRRRVAVKVLPAPKTKDTSSLERFHREARAVAALDHPNIVRAYDIDQEDNLHFLVMEHVDGANLQEIIKRTGPMDVTRAAHYIRQSALGLQHAHERDLVHRDIKPGNILVDRNGIVKLLDMGLARFFNDEEDMLTKKYDENVLGTADYLAPEQALDSHGVDIRADIYSLGGTFYFCLTGRTPFAEGTVAQKLIWHQTRQPKSVQSLRAEIPDGIAAIVEKMMAKAPEGRYQSPQELADALAPYTQTPIPPPPEQEMPQLSPAALRGPGSSLGPGSGSENTSGSKDDVTPTRKIWSVAGPAPAPAAAPAKTDAPPAPRSASPTPVSTPATAPPRQQATVTRPAVSKPKTETKAAPPVNGAPPTPRPTGGPHRPPTEEQPTWPPRDAAPAEAPADEDRLPDRRPRALPQRSTTFWVVVGLGGLVLVAGLATLIYFLLTGTKRGPRDPLRLTSSDPYALEALLRDKARPGDRIILGTDTIRGSGIFLNNLKPNLTIEAEPGKTVVWSFAPSAPNEPQRNFLLHLQGPELTLRGITFDGEGKVATAVQLYSDCPGTRLERCTFRNFKVQGLAVTSCQGTAARPVLLDDLSFETTAANQSAIHFSLLKGARHVESNRYISISSLKVTGPGKKVTTTDLKHIGPGVALPEGVQVEVIR